MILQANLNMQTRAPMHAIHNLVNKNGAVMVLSRLIPNFQQTCRARCSFEGTVDSTSCCYDNPSRTLNPSAYAIACTDACDGDPFTQDIRCCGFIVSTVNPNDFRIQCREFCDDRVNPPDCCGLNPATVIGIGNNVLTRGEYAAACTMACDGCQFQQTNPNPAPIGSTGGKTGKSCFSTANSVEVEGKGLIAMDALKIGDYARAGKDEFSRVYSFIHRDRDAEAEFLQIHAEGLKTPLEVRPGSHDLCQECPLPHSLFPSQGRRHAGRKQGH